MLDKGTYDCKSCVPPVNIPADGKDHGVTGHPYYDSLAVSIISPQVVKQTLKKDGKVTGIDTTTVAADGKSLTDVYEDHSESKPSTSQVHSERVAVGPAGAHALSGSWRETKIESVSESATMTQLTVTAEGVSSHDMNGAGYDAKFDGKDYPMTGEVSHTMVSVKRIDERTFEETDKHDGKVDTVIRMKVSANGKTATFAVEDVRHGATTRGTLHKKL